jgi:outer membrane protein assembly factor BamB
MPDGTPDVPSPLIVEGLVYLCRENGILICLEADTGNEMYKERLHPGNHRASPLFADNKIYIAAGDGTVSVVKPGKTFEVLAKNALDERIAASPVVANNTLFIRTYSALYAFSLKK